MEFLSQGVLNTERRRLDEYRQTYIGSGAGPNCGPCQGDEVQLNVASARTLEHDKKGQPMLVACPADSALVSLYTLVSLYHRDLARVLEGVELLPLLRIKHIVNPSLKS
jgi:hypothetical protein